MLKDLHPEEVSFLFDLEGDRQQLEAVEHETGLVSFKEIFDYANRSPDMPLVLSIERCLRSNANLLALYLDLLQEQAVASSIVARAASSEVYPTRKIGTLYSLKILEDDGDYVVEIALDRNQPDDEVLDRQRNPNRIEFRTPDGQGFTYSLGAMVRGVRLLLLSRDNEKDRLLLDLLQRPDLRIYILGGHDAD